MLIKNLEKMRVENNKNTESFKATESETDSINFEYDEK